MIASRPCPSEYIVVRRIRSVAIELQRLQPRVAIAMDSHFRFRLLWPVPLPLPDVIYPFADFTATMSGLAPGSRAQLLGTFSVKYLVPTFSVAPSLPTALVSVKLTEEVLYGMKSSSDGRVVGIHQHRSPILDHR